ncbi:MAG: hypothetical protein AB7U29_10620 [Desulfobulbus sp.]
MRKQLILAIFILICLSGCSDVQVTNNYSINGDSNRIESQQTGSTDRPVDTTVGAAVSATAAASQNGTATNSGQSSATAGKEQ